MRRLTTRLITLLLVLALLVGCLPASALALQTREDAIAVLAPIYGGEDNAAAILDALESIGAVDENGRPTAFTIQENGETLSYEALLEKLNGDLGADGITVNGITLTAEDAQNVPGYYQAQQYLQSALDEGVTMTPDRLQNVQSILAQIEANGLSIADPKTGEQVQLIAPGSKGSLSLMGADGSSMTLGGEEQTATTATLQGDPEPSPLWPKTTTSFGDLELKTDEAGKLYYEERFIGYDAATETVMPYDEAHKFIMVNQNGTQWYADDPYDGSGIDHEAVITFAVNGQEDNTTALEVDENATITVKATLSAAQPYPVSCTVRSVSGSFRLKAPETKTITWAAGEKGDKTVTFKAEAEEIAEPKANDHWNGKRTFLIQAQDFKNASCGDTDSWEQTVAVKQNYGFTYKIEMSFAPHTYSYEYSDDVEVWGYDDGIDSVELWLFGDSCRVPYDLSGTSYQVSGKVGLTLSDRFNYDNYSARDKGFKSTGIGNIPFKLMLAGQTLIDVNFKDTILGTGNTIKTDAWAAYPEGRSFPDSWSIDPETSPDSRLKFSTVLSADLIKGQSFTLPKGVYITPTKFELDWGNTKGGECKFIPDITVPVHVTLQEAIREVKITNISIPSGEFHYGQNVPVTVKFDYCMKVSDDMKLFINNTECHPAPNELGLLSDMVTFLYPVKKIDTGTIGVNKIEFTDNVTSGAGLGSKVQGANDLGMAITNGDLGGVVAFDGVSAFANTDCKLISDNKLGALRDDEKNYNVTIGVDDNFPTMQIITVQYDLRSDDEAYRSWVGGEAAEVPGGTVKVLTKDGSTFESGFYLDTAYVSYDGGLTRYPLFIIYDEQEKPEALVANIGVPVNATADIRKDTVELFFDNVIGGPDRGYFPTPAVFDEDSCGCKYFSCGLRDESDETKFVFTLNNGIKNAPIAMKSVESLLTKGGIFLEEEYGDVSIGGNTAWNSLHTSYALEEDSPLLQLNYSINDRRKDADPYYTKDMFTFRDAKWFQWRSSDDSIATINADGSINPTGKEGVCHFILTVRNGDVANYIYELHSENLVVKGGLAPFLTIPKTSQTRTTLQNEATTVYFTSNLTARNQAESGDESYVTEYQVDVYSINDVDRFNVPVPGATPVYTGKTTEPGSIVIPENILSDLSSNATDYRYVAIVSAELVGGAKYSASAKIATKLPPCKVRFDALDSYSVNCDSIPALRYSIVGFNPAAEGANVYYTVQKSGADVVTYPAPAAANGTIDTSAIQKPTSLKDAYVITVYARGSAEEAYSMDSITLKVYNPDIFRLLTGNVDRGSIGGTTGGIGTPTGKLTMDNTEYVKSLLGSRNQITGTPLVDLQNRVNLQTATSINYNEAAWGELSDQIQWKSSDHKVASVDYKQGGLYSDIESYNYVSYSPLIDLLLVGHKDGKATIKATHARTGISGSFEVEVKTLTNQLYLFQFQPHAVTTVEYDTMVNGKREHVEVKSNSEGELALYEPGGIISDVYAHSTKDGNAYIGTIYNENLVSGEQDITALQVYPCNNMRLLDVSTAIFYVYDAAGKPYANKPIRLRGGVFNGDVYCPDALFGTTESSYNVVYNGREDFYAMTNDKGMFMIRMDATQFYTDPEHKNETFTFGNRIEFVFEYSFPTGYKEAYYRENFYFSPGLVRVSPSISGVESGAYSSGVKSLQIRKSATGYAPALVDQTVQQYYRDNASGAYIPVGYTVNALNSTDNVGVSRKYEEVILSSTASFVGYNTELDSKGYCVVPEDMTADFTIIDQKNRTTPGQVTTGKPMLVTDLKALEIRNSDTAFFTFPFSPYPLVRNTYTLNRKNMGQQGVRFISDGLTVYNYSYLGYKESIRVKASYSVNGEFVRSELFKFGISNCADMLDAKDSVKAAQNAEATANRLAEGYTPTDMFDALGAGDVVEYLLKGVTYVGSCFLGGRQPINVTFFPTSDPAVFNVKIDIGARNSTDILGMAIDHDAVNELNYNARMDEAGKESIEQAKEVVELMKEAGASQGLLDKMNENLEEKAYKQGVDQFKQNQQRPNATTNVNFFFSGTLLCQATDDNLKKNPEDANTIRDDFEPEQEAPQIKYSDFDHFKVVGGELSGELSMGIDLTFPYPIGPIMFALVFSIYLTPTLTVGLRSQGDGTEMLFEPDVSVMFKAFAGLNYELGIARLKAGIFGQITPEVDLKFLKQVTGDGDVDIGTMLKFLGQIGVQVTVAVGPVVFNKEFGTKEYVKSNENEMFQKLTNYWENNEPLSSNSGLMAEEPAMWLAEGIPLYEKETVTMDTRDYLELYDRSWSSGGMALQGEDDGLSNSVVQSNAYPFADPVLSNDGRMLVFLSDAGDAENLKAYASYATLNGSGGYDYQGAIETSINNASYYDSNLVTSGSNGEYFAAWSGQTEELKKEMGEEVSGSDLALVLNAQEIFASHYNTRAQGWEVKRITTNGTIDESPAIASSGKKAVLAWRNMNASTLDSEGGNMNAAFNVDNTVNYSLFNGTKWTAGQIAYNGSLGTVDTLDAAMLSDGTAILVYRVNTNDKNSTNPAESERQSSANSTEILYTVIGADGAVQTNGRLTNDNVPDTNPQVEVINDGGTERFLVAWYTDCPNNSTVQPDNPAKDESLNIANSYGDVSLAVIDGNGGIRTDYPDSIGGEQLTDVSGDFRLAVKDGGGFGDAAILWPITLMNDSQLVEAVQFFDKDGVRGIGAERSAYQPKEKTFVDSFDGYVDDAGTLNLVTVESDYRKAQTVGTPVRNIVKASASFPETDFYLNVPFFNPDEVVSGFRLPISVGVNNLGSTTIEEATVTVGDQSETYTGLNLLPGKTRQMIFLYEVPAEGPILDQTMVVSVPDGGEIEVPLNLNRPDVTVDSITVMRQENTERDICVQLSNGLGVPLQGGGKTVKLALYKTSSCAESQLIGSVQSISDDETLGIIDAGVYRNTFTVNVNELLPAGETEIPDKGLNVYAKAWIENSDDTVVDELVTSTNKGYVCLKGLLSEYGGEVLTMDAGMTKGDAGNLTLNISVRNNSIQTQQTGKLLAVMRDSKGKIVGEQEIQMDQPLNGESQKEYTAAVSAGVLSGTPASIELMAVADNTFRVTFDAAANGGTVGKDFAYTEADGTLKAIPVASKSGSKFLGWFTASTEGTPVTNKTVFTEDTTIYAQFERSSNGGSSGGSSGGGGGAVALPAICNVAFDTNGGSAVSGVDVPADGKLTEPAAPTKDGYTFTGWYTDKECTQKYNFADPVKSAMTLYAGWKQNAGAENQLVLTIGEKKATAFGETKTNDVAPIIRNNRTMLPARFVAENLGAKVEWDAIKHVVTITKDETTIVLTIGSDKALVNGKEVTLDSPAFIENNRTYTPIRFVAEALGATVEWNETARQVTITKQ